MIATNITDLQREYYKLAKKMEIDMNLCTDNEIEIFEEDHDKGLKFAQAINTINKDCKVMDLIGIGMHYDTRGNTLKGTRPLYLTDDDYYNKLVEGIELGQLSMV